MAHDFGIRNSRTKKIAFFYGFAEGLFYEAFGKWELCGPLSGYDTLLTISKKEAVKGLNKALELFDNMFPPYPDHQRMDEVRKFRNSMNNDPDNDTYDIYFN